VSKPPFSVSLPAAAALGKVERLLGTWEGALGQPVPTPLLRRENRVRTVLDTVAIEGNPLSLAQATAVLDGKRVRGERREILEIQNANTAYERVAQWNPLHQRSLLMAHRVLMDGLVPDAGRFRLTQVGVMQGDRVAHLAPPPHRVPDLVQALFRFLRAERTASLIVQAIVFHYELELIHPFSDGNGRIGRLWQHALLLRSSPAFAYVPTESLIREHQADYYDALAASDQLGRCDPFLDFMLEILFLALQRGSAGFRAQSETSETRIAKARAQLRLRWFSRKDYLALFPRLSTASASRDLKSAITNSQLRSEGEHALTRYRFR
jgi:Fic family protein